MRVMRWGLFLLLVSGCLMTWKAFTAVSLSGSTVEFSIARGSTLRSATRQMVDAGVGLTGWHFNLLARLTSSSTTIKAGSYAVSEGITPWEILRKITAGDFTQVEVVFIEGWTVRQMRAALDAHPALRHDTAGLADGEVMARLGAAGVSAEGWFFPDTYLFGKGESDLTVLARAHRAMEKQLESAWMQRAPDTPLRTPYEALILASIVEKETGRPEDRGLIAGVFTNRLRIGMRLQTDPTVIYGLGERFDGNLRKRDLVTDTPHNTYTRGGLPPTPIALPGLASLKVAVNPEKTDALYFVARGDGSSEFSKTLEQHSRAVDRFQRSASRR
jgi:UPF0755 protein